MPIDFDKDYYNILGVSEDASFENIRRAIYRARWGNPDDVVNNLSKLQQMDEAYEVLHNPETRKQYDEYRKNNIDELKNMQNIVAEETNNIVNQIEEETQNNNVESNTGKENVEEIENNDVKDKVEDTIKLSESVLERLKDLENVDEIRKDVEQHKEELKEKQDQIEEEKKENIIVDSDNNNEELEDAKKKANEAIENATDFIQKNVDKLKEEEKGIILTSINSLGNSVNGNNLEDIKSKTQDLNILVAKFEDKLKKYEDSKNKEEDSKNKEEDSKKEEEDSKKKEEEKRNMENEKLFDGKLATSLWNTERKIKTNEESKRSKIIKGIVRAIPGALAGWVLVYTGFALGPAAIMSALPFLVTGAVICGGASSALLAGLSKIKFFKKSYIGKMGNLKTEASRKFEAEDQRYREEINDILNNPNLKHYALEMKVKQYEYQKNFLNQMILEKEEATAKKGLKVVQDFELRALKEQHKKMLNYYEHIKKKLEEAKEADKANNNLKEPKLAELNKKEIKLTNEIKDGIEKGENRGTILKLEVKRGFLNVARRFHQGGFRLLYPTFNSIPVRITKNLPKNFIPEMQEEQRKTR